MVVTRIKANALTCSRNAVNRSAVDDNTKFSSPSSLLLFNIANASSALLDRWWPCLLLPIRKKRIFDRFVSIPIFPKIDIGQFHIFPRHLVLPDSSISSDCWLWKIDIIFRRLRTRPARTLEILRRNILRVLLAFSCLTWLAPTLGSLQENNVK